MRWCLGFLAGAFATVCLTSGIEAAVLPAAMVDEIRIASDRHTNPLFHSIQFPGRFDGYYGGYNRDAFRHRSYWDRRYGGRYYGRRFGGYRRDDGAAIAAGFLGFVLGAAIAGSANERAAAQQRLNDRAWIDSCAARYRSFDPASGTYLGYDGYRHYCS